MTLRRTRSIGQFPIYPYLHSFSNHLTTRDNLLKECSIPDVLPSTVLASVDQPDFSFVAGDFEEVYGGRRSDGSWSSDDGGPPDDQRGQWDAVITVFFIDCARNVINFLKIIHGLLKEDGVWINLGPCLWHYENSVDKERGEGSVELSLDELKALAAKMGFLIEVRSYSHDAGPTKGRRNSPKSGLKVARLVWCDTCRGDFPGRRRFDFSPASNYCPEVRADHIPILSFAGPTLIDDDLRRELGKHASIRVHCGILGRSESAALAEWFVEGFGRRH